MVGPSRSPLFSSIRVALLISAVAVPTALCAGDFPPSTDLSSLNGANGFRLDGGAGEDRSGRSVGAVGDINGGGDFRPLAFRLDSLQVEGEGDAESAAIPSSKQSDTP